MSDHNKISIEKCSAFGSGMYRGVVGLTKKFVVQVRNSQGKIIPKGDSSLAVKLTGPEDVVGEVSNMTESFSANQKEAETGTYSVSYYVSVAGKYKMAITIDEQHIPFSPFDVDFHEGATDPRRCLITGEGIRISMVGVPAAFYIQACDMHGNKRKKGGDEIQVNLQGSTTVAFSIHDHHNGAYTVKYTPKEAGEFSVFVNIEGSPAQGSPFPVAFKQNSGSVFSWGSNSFGQLGGTGEQTSTWNPQELSVQDERGRAVNFLKFACGEYHSAAISDNGVLYTWGFGEQGQLGHGDLLRRRRPTPISNSKLTDQIRDVQCGQRFTLALTQKGSLFSWGSGKGGELGHGNQISRSSPVMISSLVHHPIRKISCGYRHSVVVTDEGEVFVWGQNDHGELGTGYKTPRATPTLLQIFKGSFVTDVAAGGYNSAALLQSGEFFTWGSGSYGQLGVGDRRCSHVPVAVDLASFGIGPIRMFAVGNQSALVTTGGDVYTWGNGGYGQLGTDSERSSSTPCEVKHLKKRKIHSVSIGDNHMAAVSETGRLYTWGSGVYGELGINELGKQRVPRYVDGLARHFVHSAACGGSHTLALIVPVEVPQVDSAATTPVPKLSTARDEQHSRLNWSVSTLPSPAVHSKLDHTFMETQNVPTFDLDQSFREPESNLKSVDAIATASPMSLDALQLPTKVRPPVPVFPKERKKKEDTVPETSVSTPRPGSIIRRSTPAPPQRSPTAAEIEEEALTKDIIQLRMELDRLRMDESQLSDLSQTRRHGIDGEALDDPDSDTGGGVGVSHQQSERQAERQLFTAELVDDQAMEIEELKSRASALEGVLIAELRKYGMWKQEIAARQGDLIEYVTTFLSEVATSISGVEEAIRSSGNAQLALRDLAVLRGKVKSKLPTISSFKATPTSVSQTFPLEEKFKMEFPPRTDVDAILDSEHFRQSYLKSMIESKATKEEKEKTVRDVEKMWKEVSRATDSWHTFLKTSEDRFAQIVRSYDKALSTFVSEKGAHASEKPEEEAALSYVSKALNDAIKERDMAMVEVNRTRALLLRTISQWVDGVKDRVTMPSPIDPDVARKFDDILRGAQQEILNVLNPHTTSTLASHP